MPIFRNVELPSCLHCVFYHLRHGSKKKRGRRLVFKVFWDLLAHFEVEGPRNFWYRDMCHKTRLSVVPSVSVESAMESNDVLKMFLRCVFERCDAVCHVSATRRNCLWRPRKPFACGPKHCRFSRTSQGCLPMSCDTRVSKVPAILRDWQELDAEQAVLRARSTRSLRERGLESPKPRVAPWLHGETLFCGS